MGVTEPLKVRGVSITTTAKLTLLATVVVVLVYEGWNQNDFPRATGAADADRPTDMATLEGIAAKIPGLFRHPALVAKCVVSRMTAPQMNVGRPPSGSAMVRSACQVMLGYWSCTTGAPPMIRGALWAAAQAQASTNATVTLESMEASKTIP
jgi:hypothetical protein